MNLIHITPVVKLRVKSMIENLFDEYNYAKVHKSGIISLRRKRWSLRRKRVLLTDIVVAEIPKRIAEVAKRRGKGNEYLQLFDSTIASILHISTYAPQFCVVDYVWDKYIHICLEVPLIIISPDKQLKLEKIYEEHNALPWFKDSYWYGIIKSLKFKELPYKGSGIISKINQIKEKSFQ